MVFYILAVVFFAIGIIITAYGFIELDVGALFVSVFFLIIAAIFLLIGRGNLKYIETERYQLQSYELSVVNKGESDSRKCIAKSCDGITFDVNLRDVLNNGDKPLLVKYESKVPIFGTVTCYDLILPS